MTADKFFDDHGSEKTFSPKKDDLKSNSQFIFVHVGQFINDMKPISWLIENRIEQNTMTVLFGAPAAGKSFVAIDKACCIATGTPYHGHEVYQGAVFYIAGEGHSGLRKRMMAWQRYFDIPLENVPLYVSECSAQFYDQESAESVDAAVYHIVEETGEKPCLIIIDTLARNFGGDENSTKDMGTFIQHVDVLKDRWNAAVIIVHHTGHTETHRARGSIALKGAADHEYRIKKSADMINIHCTKMKDGPDPVRMNFKLLDVEILHDSDEEVVISSAALQRIHVTAGAVRNDISSKSKVALDILRDCLNDNGKKQKFKNNGQEIDCITIEEYRQALKSGEICSTDNSDSVQKAIYRSLKELKSKGITEEYGGYIWLSDKTDKSGQT